VEQLAMTPRLMFRWLGWTLLYTLTLWGLWIVAPLLAVGPHDLSTTFWVWITAVLAPLALALLGALAADASWWTSIPPLVIGLSLLALTVATSLSPSVAQEAGAATVLSRLFGAGAGRTAVLLLAGLTVMAPLLAYGLARIGFSLSQSAEEPERGRVRNFARWLLIGVPLVTFGAVTGEGIAFFLGAGALFLAGRYIGLNIELWRFLR
jgi:hypothetical protein